MWLQFQNLLYCNIIINYNMLASMPDQFVPDKIIFRIVTSNQDDSEYEKYSANLKINNNKNNFYYIIRSASINDSKIFNSYIYIDINK